MTENIDTIRNLAERALALAAEAKNIEDTLLALAAQAEADGNQPADILEASDAIDIVCRSARKAARAIRGCLHNAESELLAQR